MKIGVIDSGIGGITTLGEILKTVDADYYYFLDEGNLPYSKKSREELFNISEHIVERLSILDIDIIVIACNTLTSASVVKLRSDNSIPIIGIEPALKPALKECKRVVTLATSATINGEKYIRLKKSVRDTEIIDVVGDGIQELVEKADIDGALEYLDRLLDGIGNIDGIVLGCTHYVYLRDRLNGRGIKTFDGNVGVARRVKNISKDLIACDSSNVERNGLEKSALKKRSDKSRVRKVDNKSRVFIHSTGSLPLESIAKYLKRSVFLW